MFHANGWGLPYVITGVGGKHVVLRKVDGAEILRRIEQHGVTFLCGAPAVVAAVLAAAETWDGPLPGRDRVRMVVASAPPPTSVVQRVEAELGWEFMQLYGLTETSPAVTVNRTRAEWDALPPAERAEKLVQAGAPALGTTVRVDGQGEVLVRSNTVLDGYWERPDETAAALQDGWFHTGDGGTLTDGYLTISDRKKDVIITGGENVSSIEVEDCLYGHPAVEEVAVIGVPDEKWGETIKALVVLREGAKADEAELIAHCKQRLARLQVAHLGGVPHRAGPHRHRQAAEVPAARAVLVRPGARRQLTDPQFIPVSRGCPARGRRRPVRPGCGRRACASHSSGSPSRCGC
ncbi:AMP-binding protein [Kitasatospora arboriphila]